jgi:DNA-3-methyladenine glycosylase
VYRIYGVHWCLNVVSDRIDFPAAVLVRALEPLTGIDLMRRRRGTASARPRDTDLCSGPGKLASALGIDGELDGHPLNAAPLLIARGDFSEHDAIARGPRIGVTRAADWPLRFFLRGNPHVSRR